MVAAKPPRGRGAPPFTPILVMADQLPVRKSPLGERGLTGDQPNVCGARKTTLAVLT